MYWKFDKEFELLLAVWRLADTSSPPVMGSARARMYGLISPAQGAADHFCGGAIFHSREIKLSRSTAGNYDATVRLTRSRTTVSTLFSTFVSTRVAFLAP